MRTLLIILSANLLLAAAAFAGDVPRGRIQAKIEEGVEVILSCRKGDGRFEFNQGSPVGEAALALQALEYAQPYLRGGLRDTARTASARAAEFILQQPIELETYTAGIAISSMALRDVDRSRLNLYATMLAVSQHDKDPFLGMWGYRLRPAESSVTEAGLDDWGDNSNSQFAILGLYMAARKGFAVPKTVWTRAADHYVKTQDPDGGWRYGSHAAVHERVTANMTIAGVVSLDLCEEMLASSGPGGHVCQSRQRSPAVEAGLKWIADNWDREKIGADAYGLYGLERLGILLGRSNIGLRDWFAEGAAQLVGRKSFQSSWGSPQINWCFVVAFLSHGLDPIAVNKLERRSNDWNCDPYDAQRLVDYIQDHYQQSIQWRGVTLEAPVEMLLRAPILYITGHDALAFTAEEKAKLKAYVEGGGTILGEACCSRQEFADSFRARMREIFGGDVQPAPADHRLREALKSKVAVEILPLAKEDGRPAAILLPADLSCRWTAGGADAKEAYEAGARIYLYVTKECRAMYAKSHPGSAGTP